MTECLISDADYDRWIARFASEIRRLVETQLDASASNRRAMGVYERLGYEVVDESHQYAIDITSGDRP